MVELAILWQLMKGEELAEELLEEFGELEAERRLFEEGRI